jgi:hypothetical protein
MSWGVGGRAEESGSVEVTGPLPASGVSDGSAPLWVVYEVMISM